MQLRAGTTFLDINAAGVTRVGSVRRNRAGNPISRIWTWTVTVHLASLVQSAAGRQVDFAVQEARLHNLLEVQGQEYALHADNGVPVMVLSPVGAISRPRCEEIANPVDGRGEYSGTRTFTFKITAEYPIGPGLVVLNFEESLAFEGDGGPLWEEFGSDSGASIRQIIRPNSPCFAYQAGTATGYLAYPVYGGPHGAPVSFWPAHYKSFLSRYEKQPPRVTGDTLTDWTITWNYTHMRIGSPFTGVPHLWK